MKLLLVITDGPAVRNFVHGRFLRTAREAVQSLSLWSAVRVEALRAVGGAALGDVESYEMPIYAESRASRFWRKATDLAHLGCFDTFAMRRTLQQNRPRGWSKLAVFNRAAYGLARRCQSPRRIQHLAARHEGSVRAHPLTETYRTLLRRAAPDVVFTAHQRVPQAIPLVVAARSLGIPTATFIYSWDNLTSKGRMPVAFEHYLVWSEAMKTQLLDFYPDASPAAVHVVGTPQFEPYVYSEYGWPEEQFSTTLQLSAGRRRICFSAGDVTTSPNDPYYLTVLAEASRTNAFREPVDIVVRPSPAEEDGRFDRVRREYPELRWSAPRWRQTRAEHPEPWSQRLPEAQDIDLLKSLTHYCDVNVNVASTMTLDFAHADRPVVNVAFGGADARTPRFDDSVYYRFEHYRPVLDLAAARLARTPVELIAAINSYLADQSLDARGRKALVDLQTCHPLPGTSERISRSLAGIAAS
jgi:hypothetical protein